MARALAVSNIQVDNEHVRVTEWRFPAGTETRHHVHAHDYVVVPTVPGRLTMTDDIGATNQADLTLGQSYFRQAGVSHNVVNDTSAEIVFVEIEMKDTAISS